MRTRCTYTGALRASVPQRHRIKAAPAKRMAAQQPPQRQPTPSPRAMQGNRLARVLRTSRLKPAARWKQGMKRRRKPVAVELEKPEQQALHDVLCWAAKLALFAPGSFACRTCPAA